MQSTGQARMQAGRAERLAQLLLEYLKKENEARTTSQREMQQAWTVHYEQAKIAAEQGQARQIEQIRKEFEERSFADLSREKKRHNADLSEKEKTLRQIRQGKEKLVELKRQLDDAKDELSSHDMK